MTREAFIRKWLANPQKQYDEHNRDEMRNDLDMVIEYAQQQVKNLNMPAVSVNEVVVCDHSGVNVMPKTKWEQTKR